MVLQFDQLGPYRIGKKLGQGGMGAVYEAVDTDTGQPAAVKLLAPALAADEGFRVRFEAEIDSLKKLRHPNIVRLYGYGEHAGNLFYAMELVDGTSLEEELRGGRRFDWREVTGLSIKLCRALKHAHDHGVIHRDIKPANLLLTTAGEVKLSDFGIARLFGNTRMTNDGGVLGTAEYMAPEQADGRPVTDRCDQYSLGGVMYALLSGRPPFRAGSMLEMLQLQRFAEPQPVRRYAPETPAELDRIILQLLEKDPHKRFSNAALLGRTLEAMERGLSRSSSRNDFVIADPEASDARVTAFDPMAATLVPNETEQTSADADSYELDAPRSAMPVYIPDINPSATEQPPPATRFVKVKDEAAPQASYGQQLLSTILLPQSLLLALVLAAAAAGAWYLTRPASADQLYEQITAAGVEADKLRQAEPAMREFLARYPADPRAAEVHAAVDEVELNREQSRVGRLARKPEKDEALSPVQRAYVEALELSKLDPQQALLKLRAIIDVYSGDESAEATAAVKLARRQLGTLERQVERDSKRALALIESQLQRANSLSVNDPAAARRIWQGIVTLYGDKSWAAASVNKARALLQASAAAAH